MSERRHRHGLHIGRTLRHGATQRCTTLGQIAHGRQLGSGSDERELSGLIVRQGQPEPVSKFDQRITIELLVLMRGHAPLRRAAHAEALLRMSQDDRGRARMSGCGVIGRIELHRVMSTTRQSIDLLIGHACRQRTQGIALPKEAFAIEGTVGGRISLELTIHGARKGIDQRALGVAREQSIPVTAPDQLDHMPSRAGEQGFEFIHDAPVAPHRPIQTLQIAVHHEHQVVEPLARSERERTHGLRLIHFTVAKDAPDLALRCMGRGTAKTHCRQ